MSDSDQVLDAERMRQRYGAYHAESPGVAIDPHRVPKALRRLMPYAEFWGIADDGERERLVMKAPREVQENLKAVIALFDDELDEWLAGDEADNPIPSPEYVAYSAMRMAADFV